MKSIPRKMLRVRESTNPLGGQLENGLITTVPTGCNNSALDQRVTNLEGRVGYLETEVSYLKLQHQYPTHPPNPYPYPYPYPYPTPLPPQQGDTYFLKRGQEQIRNDARVPLSQQNLHFQGESAEMAHYEYPTPPSPAPNPSARPRPPPIIFDGYRIATDPYNIVHQYLIPDSSPHTDVYRFVYDSSINKYAYIPVDPTDLNKSLTSTDDQPKYKYMFIPGYGWGLCPDNSTFGPDPSPHTITGYQYIEVTGYGWCYAPTTSSTPGPTPNPLPSTNYDRVIRFDFNNYVPYYHYYLHYHGASNYDGHYTSEYLYYAYDTSGGVDYKYPYSIYGVSTDKIIPIAGIGVGYLLPNDNNVYEVIFEGKLKLATRHIFTLYPNQRNLESAPQPLELAAGPGDPTDNNNFTPDPEGSPAYIELIYFVVDATGAIESTQTISLLTITQNDLKRDTTSLVDKILSVDGYVETQDLLITPDVNLMPASNPAGRRVISVRASSGFQFSYGKVTIKSVHPTV